MLGMPCGIMSPAFARPKIPEFRRICCRFWVPFPSENTPENGKIYNFSPQNEDKDLENCD
jgi:hypothetical protein